jgi:hypothetical protein
MRTNHAKSIVMSGRQAAPSHFRGLRRRSPLIRVERSGTKEISGRCRIAPFAVLKSGHIEMQEHAESQIHKPLLQIQELQSATRSCALRFLLLAVATSRLETSIAAVAVRVASWTNSLLVVISVRASTRHMTSKTRYSYPKLPARGPYVYAASMRRITNSHEGMRT